MPCRSSRWVWTIFYCVVTVDGRRFEVTHPDKVLFPADGITKADLVDYYLQVAEAALPHIRDRPVTMTRYPDGIDRQGFFQKDAPAYFPEWVPRVQLAKRGGTVAHVVCNDAATLAYLAAQACTTPHIGLSRTSKLGNPDRLVFDIDPPQDAFAEAVAGAQAVRQLLEELGLQPFVKTTGSKGVHVEVALDGSADFGAVREFAAVAGDLVAARNPSRLTTEFRKERREGRVFVDTTRNAYAQTIVAPYAVRALPGAPVATPLTWEELADPKLRPKQFSLRSIPSRVEQGLDPWAGMLTAGQPLEPARARLAELVRAAAPSAG